MSFFRRLKMPSVPPLAGRKYDDSAWAIEDYFRKVRDALSAWNPDASPVIFGATVDGAVTLGDTDTIAATQSEDGTGITLEVVDDSITDAKFRDSVGFSVVGRAATGTGETADIISGTDAVLGRNGSGNLAFAQVVTGQVANDAITYAKIQNVSAASRVLVRGSAGGAGDVEEGTLASGLSLVGTVLTAVPVVLSPAQIVANQNDYSPGTLGPDRTTVYVTSDASRNITGILATGIANGVTLMWINRGAQDVVLKHADAGSAAANQLLCPGAADVTLNANEAALIVRDTTSALWRVLAL